MSDLISVVIPVFNAERYLQRCVDAVLSQSYSQIEVILVDDGSTDSSGYICDEYVAKDKRVRVLHQQNQGASLARQNGLRQTRGEYVTFVDSDDWIDSEYLSTLYEMLVKYHVSVGACGVQRVNEGEEFVKKGDDYKIILLKYEDLMPRFFKYEFWGFPGKLYLRSALMQIPFPEATLSEDYLVMSKLFMQERKMAYTAAPLYFYEYHPASLSHQKLSKRAFEEFVNVKDVYELMKEHDPQFSDMALSNVVETCVKLHLMVFQSSEKEFFNREYSQIHSFLKHHSIDIMNCSSLSWKTRVLVVGLLSCPKIVGKVF